MARLPPELSPQVRAHFSTLAQCHINDVTPKNAKSKDASWEVWTRFCHTYKIDPHLQDPEAREDPRPFLELFALLYRRGIVSPSCKPVRSKRVANALCAVGQAFTRVGSPDPRKGPDGKLEPRLASLLQSFDKEDALPARVRPVPVTLVLWLLTNAYHSPSPSPSACALADMICIAFYFLLRPGEYTGTTNDDAAFTLADVRLFIGHRRLNLVQAPISQIQAATSVSLHFTTQKNQVKGK